MVVLLLVEIERVMFRFLFISVVFSIIVMVFDWLMILIVGLFVRLSIGVLMKVSGIFVV